MINKQTRTIWAEKTLELTNIAVGALFFGQFISEQKFRIIPSLLGVIFGGGKYVF